MTAAGLSGGPWWVNLLFCTSIHLHHCTPVPLHLCTTAPAHMYLCTLSFVPVPPHLHLRPSAPLCHCTCISAPLHLCTSAPLHLCTSAPLHLHLCRSASLRLCTTAPAPLDLWTSGPLHLFISSPLHLDPQLNQVGCTVLGTVLAGMNTSGAMYNPRYVPCTMYIFSGYQKGCSSEWNISVLCRVVMGLCSL